MILIEILVARHQRGSIILTIYIHASYKMGLESMSCDAQAGMGFL